MTQSERAWISTGDSLPNDGLVVNTKIDDDKGVRNEQPLMRIGNLWFYPDGSMYVYYRPTHWQYRIDQPKMIASD